jgi:hypothetical protein
VTYGGETPFEMAQFFDFYYCVCNALALCVLLLLAYGCNPCGRGWSCKAPRLFPSVCAHARRAQTHSTLTVEGTNITNCRNSETEGLLDSHYPLANMGLTMANAARKLLGDGATTSWKLDPAKGINAIVADHGVVSDEDSSIAWDVCVISIYIRRNYVVYLVKYLMITILVVMGAILTAQSLYAEDLTGDRCAILYIAFLILVTNMQSDLELGHLTSMIWIE